MNFEDLMKKLQAIEEGSDQNAMRRPMAQQSAERMAAKNPTSAPPVAPTKDDQPGAGAGDESIDDMGAGAGDEGIEECGAMPIEVGGAPKQQDNVTMNVSMNGSGAGGIRDLMAILKNIEQGGHDEPSHGDGGDVHAIFGDGYENSPEGGSEPEVYGTDAITQTGDDMFSKGKEALKVNGGGNPMHETLVAKLSEMYNEIKER